jgi:hypothetical protein
MGKTGIRTMVKSAVLIKVTGQIMTVVGMKLLRMSQSILKRMKNKHQQGFRGLGNFLVGLQIVKYCQTVQSIMKVSSYTLHYWLIKN